MTLPGNGWPVDGIAKERVVGGADLPVGAAQPEREVAVQFGRVGSVCRVGLVNRLIVRYCCRGRRTACSADRPAEGALEVAEVERRLDLVAAWRPWRAK